MKGNASAESHNDAEAERYFREAVGLDACFADGWNNLGTLRYRQKNYDEAVDFYTKASSCNPASWLFLLNRANCFLEMKQYYSSLEDINSALILNPDTSVLHFGKGLVLARMDKFDSALVSFEIAWQLDPENPETLINVGTVRMYMQQYEQAAMAFDVASTGPLRALAHNGLAMLASYQHDYRRALSRIELAIEANPNDPHFLNNRGYIFLQLGEAERALADINRSIGMDPTNIWAYRNKGLYYLRLGMPSQAIPLFERVVADGGFIDELYRYMAEAYDLLGDTANACRYFALAIDAEEDVSGLKVNCK